MLLFALLTVAAGQPTPPPAPDPTPLLRALAPHVRDPATTEVAVSAALAPAARARVLAAFAQVLGVRAVTEGPRERLPSCASTWREAPGQPPPGVRLTVTDFRVTGPSARVGVARGCVRADGRLAEMARAWALAFRDGGWAVVGTVGPIRETARPAPHDHRPGGPHAGVSARMA